MKEEEPTTDKCGLALCAHSDENQWLVDIGYSRNMIGDQNKFILLNKKDGNVSSKIAGKGIVALVNGKGKSQNAPLVRGLKHNILSVSKIFDQGHNVVFSTEGCEVRNSSSGELVAKGLRTLDNIYILSKIQDDKCYMSRVDEDWLWHK